MVLLYKRMCALCGVLPLTDAEFECSDMRKNKVLFEICRSYKVTGKRKCPVCPDCVAVIERAAEFITKCSKTQEFINACCNQKIIENKDILQLREEYCGIASALDESKVCMKKDEQEDNGEDSINESDDKPQNLPIVFVERIADSYIKEEEDTHRSDVDHQPDTPTEVQAPNEVLKPDPDCKKESDSDPESEDEDHFNNNTDEDAVEEPAEPKAGDKRTRGRSRPSNLSYTELDSDGEAKQETNPEPKKPRQRRKKGESEAERKSKLKCQHCDLVLHSEYHLRLHEEKHGPPVHVCDKCGKGFRAASLLRHHYTIHNEDRPFPCTLCSMRFKDAYSLKYHQEDHTEQVYMCHICGLGMRRRRNYHVHLKIHSDQRQYKCIVCPKTYKKSQLLRIHMITHTDIRPYQCPFCDKTYTDGSSVRLHKKRKHPQELAALEASGQNEEVLEQHRNVPSIKELKALLCAKYRLDRTTFQPLESGSLD